MAAVKDVFPFNEIKEKTIGGVKALFFPIMYFKTVTLTKGPYKGKVGYFVSKSEASGYHLAPTFYKKGGTSTATEGAYFAGYAAFSDGKTDGWYECNIYDFHFLKRLYLISRQNNIKELAYGGYYYSLGKAVSTTEPSVGKMQYDISKNSIMVLKNNRSGEYIPNLTFTMSGCPKSFKTNGAFEDLFLPDKYGTDSEALAETIKSFETYNTGGRYCYHSCKDSTYLFGWPKWDPDLSPTYGGPDNAAKKNKLYVKVV